MNVAPGRWRRLAIKLMQHATRIMPDGGSIWAEAMRNELDYIEDDPGALIFALGCVLVSYRCGLADMRSAGARRTIRRIVAGGLVALFAGYAVQNAAGQTQPPQPTFTEAECDLPNLSAEIRPRLRCGTVSVPRNHDDPSAGRFKLAVVVVRSQQQPAMPEPVVYINGGPGSPLTVYASYQATRPYAPARDLILVDQRGIGRSEPQLCPALETDLRNANIAAIADPTPGVMAKRRKVYMACRDQAIAQGIDLKDFGTSVTVEDFEWVRKALGVTRWNVYGESYGTTVAMTLMAHHPDAIRSAVLDSVNPPDPILPPWSANVADARDAFFAACSKDPGCAASFPDLAELYRRTAKRLESEPLTLSLPPEAEYTSDHLPLTKDLFEVAIGMLLYYPTAYASLPRLISAVHAGDLGLLRTILLALNKAPISRAADAAVTCRDRPRYRQPPAEGQDSSKVSAFDRIWPYFICDDWSELGPLPVIPIGSEIPTLVLAGEFDPNARPAASQQVAEMIGSQAQWIEFAGIGHNVRAFSPCGMKLAAQFIDNPDLSFDASCAKRAAPIQFLAPFGAP